MVFKKKVTAALAGLLLFLNILALLVIGWSCFRGIDLSDESYYYLGYLYFNNDPDLYPASFHLVFGRLFSSFGFTLTDLRFLRLFLTIVAIVPLYLGMEKIIQHKSRADKVVLFNVMLSGMLMSYVWGPLTLSYNSMSSILIAIICGLWLLAVVSDTLYSRVFYSLLLGFLFTLLFFVKITNVLLLPILVITTFYFLHKKKSPGKRTLKPTLICITFFCIGSITSLALIGGGVSLIPEGLEKHVQESFAMSDNPTHSFGYLTKRYYDNAEMVVKRLKYPCILLVVFFTVLLFLIRSKKGKKLHPETLFNAIAGLILIITVVQDRYWTGGSGFHYQVLIPYLFIGVLVLMNRYLEKRNIDFVLLLSLLFIPVAGAVGTNNGLSLQVLIYGLFIFLTLYYLVYSSQNFWYKHLIFFAMVLLGTTQITTATIFHPYRQARLTEAVHRLEGVDVLDGLQVDGRVLRLREELAFLDKVDATYVFTYSLQKGMTLLANKKPFSLEWFHENEVQKMCGVINKSKIEPSDLIFLIPDEAPLEKEVVRCLEEQGIFLNKQYFIAKTFKFFDRRWKKEMTLHVYQPSLQ